MDRQMLENYIEDKPESALFPMLAEQFLLSNDFEKAHKACSEGLSFHPESVPGLFIEARIFMAEEKFMNAEQLLKKVISLDPRHYNGHVLLAECQVRLKRADSTLKRVYSRIHEMDEGNEQAKGWLASAVKKKPTKTKKKAKPKAPAKKTSGKKAQTKTKAKKKTEAKAPALPERQGRAGKEMEGKKAETKSKAKAKAKLKPPKQAPKKKQVKSKAKPSAESKSAPELKISPEIATFTLVAVLKSQHLYAKATDVLAVMSRKKDADKERIKEEREKLQTLLKSEEENK